jgi:Leucine-rich repeat (LRR) protein
MPNTNTIGKGLSNLSERSTSKRKKIREMLTGDKDYTAQEIAKAVRTTLAYVWKEKSQLKANGPQIGSESMRRAQVSESKDETSFIPKDGRRRVTPDSYNYNHHYRFLNIRDLEEDGLKTLYTELKDGKKPADIIAKHGFHPEVVEKEYQRFSRLNEHNIVGSFQKKIIESLSCIGNLTLTSKLEKEGHLSVNEFIELIRLRLNQDIEIQNKLERRRNEESKI